MDYKKLAEMLYPTTKDFKYYLEKYKARENLRGEVTRYAPSPTGYMHIGNFFQMFISYNLAKNTNGIFIKRLEDTDQKREKEGAFEVIKEIMDKFGIFPDEYQEKNGDTKGEYGPYIQTDRLEIYHAFAKYLVSIGRAFPCFCKAFEDKSEILKDRETKFKENDVTEYDPCRDLTLEEVEAKLKAGETYAIRLRTQNTGKERAVFTDLIKGEINALANAKDVILVKRDGIPPYTFCHIIDDKLMGVTTVVRGEEYISSTPVHLEIIDALGFERFKYCHNPLICKIPENGNKRKISKRYDPEADMRFYFEQGYPNEAVLEYLLNIISSAFEEWRRNNPEAHWSDFKFGINDITAVSPIFDLVKLNDISKNIIAKQTAAEVYDRTLAWAKTYNPEFATKLENDKTYAIKIFSIDRGGEKPRKDIFCYSMIPSYYEYFFNDYKTLSFASSVVDNNKELICNIFDKYASNYKPGIDKDTWFANVKEMAVEFNFCTDNKAYKAEPEKYNGNVATFCNILRVCITGRENSPDLYSICETLGKDELINRANMLREILK
ncbi:MAG: glutamate--tRNA ligase [Clostridiales bacterium]|nr:glutamate--tRNA ligase [Clostridiales bacterium]